MTSHLIASGTFTFQAGAWLLRCAALVFLLLGVSVAWADPPARAGRIADVAGNAWIFDVEAKSWNRLLRNQTVGQGDQLRTDARARVTLRVGTSTVWVDEESDIEVLQLDDGALALRLLAGDVALRLRTARAAEETRVHTREGTISPEMEGLFRVDQLDRGTRVAAVQGRAQFDSDPGGPVQRGWLREGEQSEFWLAESPRVQQQRLSRDAFSTWFLAQDRAEGSLFEVDEAYVSPEMTGAEDLNQHGNWETATEYGNVWYPSRMPAGWEPYRDGSWVWTRHWGWSWVDNAPWGFAPFHYGRWVQLRGRWCWAPGRFEPRPTYAPALVAWTGGANVSVGITVGGVRRPPRTGWAPLPPRQVYAPIHAHTPQYVERFQWDRETSRGRNEGRTTRPVTPRGDDGPPAPQRPVAAFPSFPNGNFQTDDRDRNSSNRQGDRRFPHPVNAPLTNPRESVNREPDRARGDRTSERFNAPVAAQQNIVPQPPVTVPQAPAPARYQVPIFNRPERQSAPTMALPTPTPTAPAPVQAAPQVRAAKPVDDELPSGNRNKRERPDKEMR